MQTFTIDRWVTNLMKNQKKNSFNAPGDRFNKSVETLLERQTMEQRTLFLGRKANLTDKR